MIIRFSCRGHSKCIFAGNFQFLTPSPFVWPCSVTCPPLPTHTQSTFAYVPRRLWIFGWKIRKLKEKINFLVNSKRSMFFTQFYIQWQKNQNGGEKKCLRFFNKKAPLYAGLGSKQKLLPTSKQLIRKNSVCSFKNQVSFFHRANLQIDCLFSCAF